jgi:hypothetical protein
MLKWLSKLCYKEEVENYLLEALLFLSLEGCYMSRYILIATKDRSSCKAIFIQDT